VLVPCGSAFSVRVGAGRGGAGSADACAPQVGWSRFDHPHRASSEGHVIDVLIISILAVAAVALIVMQAVYRRRVLRRREAAGQTVLGKGPFILLGVMAAFFVFAVFVFPALVRAG